MCASEKLRCGRVVGLWGLELVLERGGGAQAAVPACHWHCRIRLLVLHGVTKLTQSSRLLWTIARLCLCLLMLLVLRSDE